MLKIPYVEPILVWVMLINQIFEIVVNAKIIF
jgi:hypothetical protein